MKKIWYLFVKSYMRLGFSFYFKKILISGTENIPKDKAILFVANHQNALIDPLLIGAVTPRELNFLTRADVFNKPVIRALLSTVNMLPIYRIKDGMNSLSKNEEVFQKCYKILDKNGTVLIFPEGNHNIKRRLRVLSKGFTRIIFGALHNKPDLEIVVVPIGINYSNAKKYASSVHLVYGQPIPVNDHHRESVLNGASSDLKNDVSEALKKLITHIENLEHHDKIAASFKEEEFLNPDNVNEKLLDLDHENMPHKEDDNQFHFLRPFVKVNSFIPILVWKYLYPKIVEEEFIATHRFTIGITLVPICYLIQAGIIASFTTGLTGLIYLGTSLLIVYLFVKSS
ncbi:lysophospholipid acyltransferase family protein [Lutimonas vermicola]|uniref:Lysophospholipid acyltransferase family protein n=1 Tax=Lutimonas vermicola TaxID=414288 RepID=A0ABU9L0H1_9FLAO